MGENERIKGTAASSQIGLEQRERLASLADMLSELQTMAEREGCETLAGLLGLSHAEARRQVSGRRS